MSHKSKKDKYSIRRICRVSSAGLIGIAVGMIPAAVAHAQFNLRTLRQGYDYAASIAGPSGLPEWAAGQLITRIIWFILGLSATISVAVIVVGGIMYIISLGDEQKAARAKRILLFAIIGLAITGGAFMIVRFVGFILTGVFVP